jgi:hypothetical protein
VIWNGASWSPQRYGKSFNAKTPFGISCWSATACTAVGTELVEQSGDFVNLPSADIWNGTTWSHAHVPNPLVSETVLQGVSCASATACTAVGSYVQPGSPEGGNVRTLAEVWDATHWSIQGTAFFAGDSFFQGISCPSAKFCMAVGEQSGGKLLAETRG